MIDEFKRSVNKILNERLTSPFWGAFICSWLVFNWKIVYLTIFIDQDKIEGTKIDYIITNYCDYKNLIWFPLSSAILLIVVFPFITTGAYWINIKFNKWKNDLKNKVDGASLLTLEKSVQIREEIKNIHKKYEEVTKESEEEIKILNAELNALKESIANKETTYNSALEENERFREDIKNMSEHVVINSTDIKEIEQLKLLNKRYEDEISKLKGDVYTHDLKKKANGMILKYSSDAIDELISEIIKGNEVDIDNEIIETMLKYNYLVLKNRNREYKGLATFEFTPSGSAFKDYFYSEG